MKTLKELLSQYQRVNQRLWDGVNRSAEIKRRRSYRMTRALCESIEENRVTGTLDKES